MNTGVNIRMASDDDGPDIGLFIRDHFDAELFQAMNWVKIFPFWAIAETNGKMVGVVQICPGLPVGRIENLHVDQSLDPRKRARIVTALIEHGEASIKNMGCTAVASMVSRDAKQVKKAMKRRGARVVDSGNNIMRAI